MINLNEFTREQLQDSFFNELRELKDKYQNMFYTYSIAPQDFERWADTDLADEQIKELVSVYESGEGMQIVANGLMQDTIKEELNAINESFNQMYINR
jgi:uncharacterized protein YoaH (UPF0181 family)